MTLWDLPPWQQLPYLSPVKVTNFLGASLNVQLCTPNNQRYGLVIAIGSLSANALISLTPNATGNSGFPIPTNPGMVYFSTNTYPNLVGQSWYTGSGGFNWSVFEFFANDWPQQGDHYLDAIKQPPPSQSPIVLPSAPGVGGSKGIVSYWQSLMQKIKGG